jgi:PleD family two-component response regulator
MPEVANTPEALVQAADKAMYRVKESGKDGIRLASE